MHGQAMSLFFVSLSQYFSISKEATTAESIDFQDTLKKESKLFDEVDNVKLLSICLESNHCLRTLHLEDLNLADCHQDILNLLRNCMLEGNGSLTTRSYITDIHDMHLYNLV